MATKYQIFVSSTFEDLEHERDIVIKAALEMGHIPVGMEMFSAADEQQWQIIARHIDESDYYCVILAHRYGSVTEGISYTRKEYEYACDQGIPVLGFILDESVSWPPEMVDKTPEDVARLGEFKSLVRSKPVSFWKSAEDLYGKVSIALTKQITANPREGWVRASAVVGPQVTNELSRLSAENASLRQEISGLAKTIEDDHTAEVRTLFEDLRNRSITLSYKYTKSDAEWSQSKEETYASCFFDVAAMLASEVELDEAAKSLAMYLREDSDLGWWTVATNQVREYFANLMALGLVEPSKRRHAVSDSGEYWSLTELGNEVHGLGRRWMMDAREFSQTDEKPVAKKTPAKKTPAKKTPAKKTAGDQSDA